MSYYTHHAIIVTAHFYSIEAIQNLHDFCKSSPLPVTSLVKSNINGYWSFMVAPDGSKEGVEISDEGDKWRKLICDKIDEMAYDDGSNQFSYAEVEFGVEDSPTESEVIRTNSGKPGFRV